MKEKQSKAKKSFCEWFDPYNPKHLEAYKHLQDTGFWPEDFWKEAGSRFIETNWQLMINSKLANAWIDSKVAKDVLCLDCGKLLKSWDDLHIGILGVWAKDKYVISKDGHGRFVNEGFICDECHKKGDEH